MGLHTLIAQKKQAYYNVGAAEGFDWRKLVKDENG